MKRPELLELVALERNLPEFRLRAGHVGTVVEVYFPDGLEVEFLDRGGDTVAVLTLYDTDVRVVGQEEVAESDYPDPLPPSVKVPWADATRRADHSRDSKTPKPKLRD